MEPRPIAERDALPKPEVFDSLSKIMNRFSDNPFWEKNGSRRKALSQYFEKRGVVQLTGNATANGWPKLVYPTGEQLDKRIETLEKKYREVTGKKWQWQVAHTRASTYHIVSHAKKITDPLFWKHVGKKITDKQYRSDSDRVDLHSNLIADKKYRPMVEAFVENDDYRKQLTETVKHSPVYQNHRGLAKHAEDKRKLQAEVSKSWLSKTNEQVKGMEKELFMLKELLKWEKEGKKGRENKV